MKSKTFYVTFTAETVVEVLAIDEKDAVKIARRQLDPDVDWDYKSTSEEEQ